MSKVPLLALVCLVCLPGLAFAQVTVSSPPSATISVGLETSFTVTGVTNFPGRTVTVSSTPLPSGATLMQMSSGAAATYQFTWTPSLGQSGANVCFIATDNGGASSPQSCTNLQIAVAEIIHVSGIVRDFAATHSDMNRPPSAANMPDFVAPTLGPGRKPVFSGPAAGVSNFNQWFNDVPGVNTTQVHSVTLSNFQQPDPNTFQYASGNFAPPNTGGRFFTWEVHTFINYVPGQSFTFSSSDDMWIFIDGTLVPGANLHGVHGPRGLIVNLDALGLDPARVYALDIFYAHRGASSTPSIQLQLNAASLCAPGDVSTPAVTVPPAGFTTNDWQLLGRSRIVNGELRAISASDPGPTGGAAWVKTLQQLGRGFEARFRFTINNVKAAGFEGFAMVLQSNSLTARGGDGFNLGYASVEKSLAIEFDSHHDGALFDPLNQHISVHSMGNLQNSSVETSSNSGGSQLGISVFDPVLPLTFQNGSPQEVRVSYIPGPDRGPEPSYGWLRVFMNDNLVPTAQAQIDNALMAKVLDSTGRGYLGFTSSSADATGGDLTIHSMSLHTMPVSSLYSAAIDPPGTSPWSGLNESFLIQVRDACGQLVHYGGNGGDLDVDFTGTPPLASTVTDLLDGTYRVDYTPPVGSWDVHVRLRDADGTFGEIENSPFTAAYVFDDADGDSVHDSVDNCPAAANADQANADGDALGNMCDPDDDNDGVPDAHDAFPFDPAESLDTDGDNIGDHADTDDDGDGTPDVDDVFPLDASESVDTDGDGDGNNADPDDDGDGQSDAHELQCGSDPLSAASRSLDSDNDNLPDCVDPVTPVPTGPLAAKQGIVASLQSLSGSLSPANRRRVEFALSRLARTLDGSLWLDGSHLGPRGERVFHDDALAIASLARARPQVAALTTAMTTLVDGDRLLATVAIADARGAGGDARWIAKALAALGAGDRQRARQRLSIAVEHYRAAWVYARRAARRAPSLFPAGTELVEAIAELTDLIPGASRSDSTRLSRAIGHIQSALQPALWVDASHLARRRGDSVFTHLSGALEALDAVSGQAENVAGAMDTLVSISRALAETAVDEADNDGESDRIIARARESLERGDDDQDGGRNAIDHYRQAWTLVR